VIVVIVVIVPDLREVVTQDGHGTRSQDVHDGHDAQHEIRSRRLRRVVAYYR
jgi:hypothetical protein